MENKNENNQSDLHILNVPDEGGTCYEYCNELKTWFGLYPDINEQIYDLWPGFIHCNNCHPLFNYLTDEKISIKFKYIKGRSQKLIPKETIHSLDENTFKDNII